MFCPNCGSIIADSSDRCRHCGIEVQAAVPRTGRAPAAAAGPPPRADSFCRRCGAELDPKAVFCGQCGTSRRAGVGDPLTRSLSPAEGYSWVLTLVLCGVGFFGFSGIHRLYTGHILIGIVQLLTFGACGIWTLIDIILIAVDEYRDVDGRKLVR